MSYLTQLFRARRNPAPPLGTARAARPPGGETLPFARMRFVVVDVETSGLDPWRDRLLSIGAVPIEDLHVLPGNAFGAVLQDRASCARENVLVHGLTPARLAAGNPAAETLRGFLDLVGGSPCVAFHAPFDRAVLDRALHAAIGARLASPWLDLAALAPALVPQARLHHRGLDDWLAYFGVAVHARHDAVYDAHATAALFLILLARARARGLSTFAQLRAEEHGYTNRHRR